MSAAGRTDGRAPADSVATACREADFVRLLATADGDALAATGVLARALDAVDVPYQASLAGVPGTPATTVDCTVAVGHDAGDVALATDPLSRAAHDAAAAFAPEATDPTLALAGVVAAGEEPTEDLLEAADLERHPGVATPTPDVLEGLAYTTLVHADFSGDPDAVEAALADLAADDGSTAGELLDDDGAVADGQAGDESTGRRLASFVALSVVDGAPPRAARAVERALRPYACDRFETLAGYADVLDALAVETPGTGIALALGRDLEAAALEVWRRHGRRAHRALREADTARYGGVFVARVDADVPLASVARLCFAYRSPEPVALVVADGAAAAVGDVPIDGPLSAAASRLDGAATARGGRGAARFDGDATDFATAFREVL